jgi:hypothetical protein
MAWEEQYQRMRRWHDRVRAIHVEPGESPNEALDTLHAFFESALHLRDWIANDPDVLAAVREGVRAFVRTNEVLAICHDLAIGAKHLVVDRPHTDEGPHLDSREVTIYQFPSEDGEALGNTTVQFGVMLNRRMVYALEFASECVSAWDSYLLEHGMGT